jgi:hypothetical protein
MVSKVSKKHKVGKVPRGNEILETFQNSDIFDTFDTIFDTLINYEGRWIGWMRYVYDDYRDIAIKYREISIQYRDISMIM